MARLRSFIPLTGVLLLSAPAAASFLDSDFYCRTYGCVIIHDGISFDVYDNYNFATGGTVPVGGQMIPWSGNPIEGVGEVQPVITGSLTEGFHAVPLQDQSVNLGIDADGDGFADNLVFDINGSGFLDAGDQMNAFSVTANTSLVAATTSAQRSFFLSSRTDFYLTAQSTILGVPDALNRPETLSRVSFDYDFVRSGNDDGMAFGSAVRNGNQFRSLGNVDDLSDIYGRPVRIMEFRQPIRRVNAPDLADQSIRFDYVYGFENYDLSLGDGHLEYEIEFDVYNR